MKKSVLIYALILCLTLPTFVLVAQAHPGRTDSRGGHTNRSTGEYHYHHGYSAHDHYDMDGDGVTDCPYDFNGKTGANSGSSSTYRTSSSGDDNVIVRTETITKTVTKEVPYIPKWVYWVFAFLCATILCLILSNYSKKSIIDCLNKKERELIRQQELELESAKKSYQKQFEDQEKILEYQKKSSASQMEIKDKAIETLALENKDLTEKLHQVITTVAEGEPYFPSAPLPQYKLFTLTIPDDVYFIDGCTPVKGEVSKASPFGDFTVYVSSHGKVYHLDRFCSAGITHPVHMYEVPDGMRPCLKCGYRIVSDTPEWYHPVKKIKAASLQKKSIKKRT